MVRRSRELYVEGGGDKNPSLASECRKAFSELFKKAGVAQRPAVVVCGGRKSAYDQFCGALAEGEADVWLLVDAEDLPSIESDGSPWGHVKKRKGDGWERPAQARDDQLHFMTVVMETWLLADPAALKEVLGPKLDANKLPAMAYLERADKDTIKRALRTATEATKSGRYDKGTHSFKILERVSPDAIRKLTWGKRFLDSIGAGACQPVDTQRPPALNPPSP